jgi:putative transposase
VEKANRRTQARFRCRACGYELNADLNGARNIRWRAGVNQPIAVCQLVLELELQAHSFRGGS